MLVFITFVVLVTLTTFPQLFHRRGDRPDVSLTGDECSGCHCCTSSPSCNDDVSKEDVVTSHLKPTRPNQWISPYRNKSLNDWILDGCGLFVQGAVIPVLQITLIYHLWVWVIPSWENQLTLPWAAQLAFSFILIDYLYYWNHRLLHSPYFWWIHQVHHTVTEMDVFGTSRNTLWSSFFIIYLWIHTLMIYSISDPSIYMFGMSLTAALDLWRHSALSISKDHWLFGALDPWLILPKDHAHHHSTLCREFNFGANIKLWDKIHRTYYDSPEYPKELGIQLNLSLVQQLILPLARHH